VNSTKLGVSVPIEYGGTEAMYLPHERAMLRSMLALADAGVIERSAAVEQIGLLHDLKSMLGATILADDDPWREPPKTAIEESSEAARAA
jgi:hypothetical protein